MSEVAKDRRLPVPMIAGVVFLVLGAAVAVQLIRGGKRPPEAFLPRPTAFVTDIVKSEDTYDLANPSIKGTFIKGLKGRDWGLASSALARDFRGRFPAPGAGKEVPAAGLALRDYSQLTLPDLEADGFIGVLKAHIEGWSAVERTTWRPFEFLLDPSGKSAFASVHFQVAGTRPDETRADLSGTVRVGLVTGDGKDWKIRRFEWADGCRAEASRGPWADITEQTGLTFNESEEVRRLHLDLINDRGVVTLGGLAIVDWNRDGFWDVLATRVNNQAVLFLNDGKGGFVRGPSPIANPAEVGYILTPVDLDGDGQEELVSSQITAYEGNRGWCGIYRKRGDGWEFLPKALEFPVATGVRGIMVQGIVPGDLDGDGDLDLLFCNYSTADSNGPNYNRIAAYDGADNWLFMNQGGLKFTEESDARGIVGTQFTYVAKMWDFTADGKLDILEGNDFGPNHLWVNDGTGHFRDAKDHIFDADSGYTMGLSVSDWDNTGDWTLYTSNMYSHAGNRIVPLAADLGADMRRLGKALAQGNRFYERRSGAWTEDAVERGVNWADWAWGGTFFDAENDTDKDIFVPNGYTTNEDPKAPDY